MKWLAAHRMGLLGFAVAAAFWPALTAPAYTPRWAAIAIGVPLAASLDWRNLSPGILTTLLFGLGLGAVSLIASPDRLGGGLELLYMAMLVMTCIAGAGLDETDGLMTGVGCGLALSVAIGLLQYFEVRLIWAPDVVHAPIPLITPDPAGLFFNSEVFAEFAALVCVWAFAKRLSTLGVIALLPVLAAHSRVGVASIVLALGYAWLPKRATLRVIVITLGVALTVAGGLLIVQSEQSANLRAVLWGATIISFLTTPFGSGLGWFTVAHPIEQYAHSDVLQALAELGVGAVVLLVIPFAVFRGSNGSRADRATFLAVCVQAVVSYPLHMPATGFLAAMFAGFLLRVRSPVRDLAPGGRSSDGSADPRRHRPDDPGVSGRGRHDRGDIPARPVLAASGAGHPQGNGRPPLIDPDLGAIGDGRRFHPDLGLI